MFCPDRPKSQDIYNNDLFITEWAEHLNITAALQNYGQDTHSTFIPFTPRFVEQHIALYITNGLSPSPKFDMEFSLQS